MPDSLSSIHLNTCFFRSKSFSYFIYFRLWVFLYLLIYFYLFGFVLYFELNKEKEFIILWIFFYLELGCLNSSTLISLQRKKQIGKTNELKNDVPSRTPNITNITAKRDIKDFNENRRENGTFLLKIRFKFSRKNQHQKKISENFGNR